MTRTEHDGSITVLMDKFEGKPLKNRLFMCGSTSIYAVYVEGRRRTGAVEIMA